jgi:MFS family permease
VTAAVSEADAVLKGGWYTLWTMLALTLFAFVDRQVLTLAAAPISAGLHLSDGQLGMVQGLAFALFAVGIVYPVAWLADRFDRRLIIGLCVICWTIGTIGCGLSRTFGELFASAVAMAAGEAGLAPIASSFVPELFKGRKRLLANGLLYIFSLVGVGLGMALGGQAIGLLDTVHDRLPAALRAYESWRLAFFLVALPAPIFLALIAFTRLGRASVPAPVEGTAQGFGAFLREHWRALATVFGGLGIFSLGFCGYIIWLPVVTARLFGTSPAQNGNGMGLATAIATVGGVTLGTLLVRRWIVRVGPVATIRVLRWAMVATLPLYPLFLFVQAAWQAFGLFALAMMAVTTLGCLTPTMLQDMAPPALRVRMFALWTVFYGGVVGLSPMLGGWVSTLLATLLGPAPRLLLVALCLLALPTGVIGIVLLRLAERPFTRLIASVADADVSPP